MTNPQPYALVIHVWHLDTLDDLVAACKNFPAGADRFVTFSDSFCADKRRQITLAFPDAHPVPVQNIGQDIGALFQLMEQVDFSGYDFICKIHTKQGMKMPEGWRRTLLDGVLGSQQQVRHIIDAFRTDPQLMLAGAKPLFLYGPAHLWDNSESIGKLAGSILQGFDYHRQDWGFIAGTCFWIRTEVLQQLKALNVTFQNDLYSDDGTPAHAIERLFGMIPTVKDGKIMLTDQSDNDNKPQIYTGLPEGLVRTRQYISDILNNIEKPQRRRVAVFASYSDNGILPVQVLPYLKGLRPHVEQIVVVCDNDLDQAEIDRLRPWADHIITGRHGEYDFGSYKRGVAWARKAGHLDNADDLILCNDSCFAPIDSFDPMFKRMDARFLDFWGASDSREIHPHLQSYFVVLGWNVFQSPAFRHFMKSITKQPNVQQVIIKYEIGLTKTLDKAGFAWGAMVENRLSGVHDKDPTYRNITLHPLRAVEMGLPMIKVKALRQTTCNATGPSLTLDWLKRFAPNLYEAAVSDIGIAQFQEAPNIAFSLIMPTWNRAWCIQDAIQSVIQQTHQNFELIIVDDGSTDDTGGVIKQAFSQELAAQKIRYIRLDQNVGVCNARNIGISHARADWIGYVDSDNKPRPNFLTLFANAILEFPHKDCFYGQLIKIKSGDTVSRQYVRKDLLQKNFIDLGVFIHRKSLITRYGGFDPELRRLVDWDLIIRLTGHKAPQYIPRIVLDYDDDEQDLNSDRISVRECMLKANMTVLRKHSPRPTVSTVILSYNHQEFIVEAIESALAQRGDYHHEILLSDDGSNDGTARIMARYAEKYPGKIRNISTGGNLGVSGNYQHCIHEAAGNFIAILEGDDYWNDPHKNEEQAEFLTSHPKACAVFSRIELYNMADNNHRTLKRQDGLPKLLSGAEFAQNEHLNIIANFSSTMFRRNILAGLPPVIFTPRINEIALAFHLDRLGKIGFINKVMGVYRINPSSVWSGADATGKLEQAIAVRESALSVAAPIYHHIIRRRIREKRQQLEAILSKKQTGAQRNFSKMIA